MQLLSPRIRIVLTLLIWLISVGALALWLSSGATTRITVAGGPAGSETLDLTTSIAHVLNKSNTGFEMRVFETGGSTENLRYKLALIRPAKLIPWLLFSCFIEERVA